MDHFRSAPTIVFFHVETLTNQPTAQSWHSWMWSMWTTTSLDSHKEYTMPLLFKYAIIWIMIQFLLIIQGQATPGSHLTTVIATDPDEEREGLRYSIRGQVKAPKQVIKIIAMFSRCCTVAFLEIAYVSKISHFYVTQQSFALKM